MKLPLIKNSVLMLATAFVFSGCVIAESETTSRTIPGEFTDGIFFATPTMANGQQVRFYTDTGGGFNAIKRSVASQIEPATLGHDSETIEWPIFQTGMGIPSNPVFRDGQLQVVDDSQLGHRQDGFLGGRWFANRIWEFDYPRSQLLLHESLPPYIDETWSSVPLGFQVDEKGQRTMHFARLPIDIDGIVVQVLFDTGARIEITEESSRTFGRQVGQWIGGSFMCAEVFDLLRSEHPEWRYIERGDLVSGKEFAMIEVEEIMIAGISAGPVWFARRPDYAFKSYMTQFMDQEICGAIGGSGLRYFRSIIDYSDETLWLQQISP